MRLSCCLVVVLWLANNAEGQTPQPPPAQPQRKETPLVDKSVVKKSGLEDALETAFKNNPDLKVALAKVMKAEADLEQARMELARKVVSAYQEVEASKVTVEMLGKQARRMTDLYKAGAGSTTEMTQTQQALGDAKAKQATAEANLAYLLGQTGNRYFAGKFRFYDSVKYQYTPVAVWLAPPKQAEEATVDAKLRAILEKRMTLKVTGVQASKVLDELKKAAPDLHIQIGGGATFNQEITANLSDVTWGAVLQLLEDVTDRRAVVRSYGLLLVPRETIGRDATLLGDMLKPSQQPPVKK